MSPFVHAVRPILVDLAATLFFYVLLAISGDVTLATGLGVGLGVLQLIYMKARGNRIAALQWVGLALVVVMGGATLLTHDARFILLKPTLIYVAIGAAMLQPGWMGRYMPPIAIGRIPEKLVTGAGFVWAGLMFVSAALNLVLALTVDPKTAASMMAAWSPASKIVLFALQYATFRHVARRNIIAARLAEAAA